MIEAVELKTADGVTLRGEVAMCTSDWIILVHPPGADIDAWRPLSDVLEEVALTVLAVDLRGHGGSDGEPGEAALQRDVDAMLEYADSHGALRMYLGFAGPTAAVASSIDPRHDVRGIVFVAPVGSSGDDTPLSRLVLHDPGDPAQATAADTLRDLPGWSLAISIPGAGPGLDALRGEWGENVAGYVTAFLRDIRQADRLPAGEGNDADHG